jgi:hypothetical protein
MRLGSYLEVRRSFTGKLVMLRDSRCIRIWRFSLRMGGLVNAAALVTFCLVGPVWAGERAVVGGCTAEPSISVPGHSQQRDGD